MKKTLSVFGMTCHKCVAHVKMALEELNEVKSAEVSLQEQSAVVELNEDVADEVLKNAVEEFGYEVREVNSQLL